MLRDSIPGINALIDSDPTKGSTILVMGEAGSLKTAFVFSVMSHYLSKKPDELGTYITLDEKRESHQRNMASLGIKDSDRLQISDIASFRTDFKMNSGVPVDSEIYFDQITHILLENLDKKGKAPITEDVRQNTAYALDSVNAFLAMTRNETSQTNDKSMCIYSLRNKLFSLLSMLRENNAVNFLIFETTGEQYRPEFFLVDGVIELGIIKYKDEQKRYIQIKKMKGIKHSLDKFLIEVTPKGLEIISKIIP